MLLTREEIVIRIQELPPDQQAAAASFALELYGEAPQFERFEPTRFDPASYIQNNLGWSPWHGDGEHPGQTEIIDAYVLAVRQQLERRDYQAEKIAENDLQYWKPGQTIKYVIRVEAGHTVGKTKLASGIVNHFYDHFQPAIVYFFAPTGDQIKLLLWKEIASDREGKGLPGRILGNCELRVSPNHFAIGRATDNTGGKGTHRVHGQHGEYLMFVVDEAEAVADYVFDAIDSMTSGGVCIVLMLANPQTRSSRFHKLKAISNVQSFRISCIHHPNVVAGREIIPGGVQRQYVETMIEKHCEVVTEHSEDDHTFELVFDARVGDVIHPMGTIFKPNAEFLFRVLGIAPKNIADNTLITPGRYEAATKRAPSAEACTWARLGIDVSRWGADYGTLYIRLGMNVWREAQFWKQSTTEYLRLIREAARKLAALGVTSLHLRIDGGGGFASGIVDPLEDDLEMKELFEDFQIFEVHFNATAHDGTAYADLATEMYGEAAETLRGISIIDAPEALEADLCERIYKWVNNKAKDVKKLESKDDFRKPQRAGHSPDDGDGFVLCVGPDFLFESRAAISVGDSSRLETKASGTAIDDLAQRLLKRRQEKSL
jgi:hypothetical protein